MTFVLQRCFGGRPAENLQLISAQFLSRFSFTLLPYYLICQLDMEARLPLVMLATIGLFLFPWKIISDKINQGPAYALRLFIVSCAVIATSTR